MVTRLPACAGLAQSFEQRAFGYLDALPTQDDFVKWAVEFPTRTFKAPIVIAFTTRPYFPNVKGIGVAFEPIATNIKLLTGKKGAARPSARSRGGQAASARRPIICPPPLALPG